MSQENIDTAKSAMKLAIIASVYEAFHPDEYVIASKLADSTLELVGESVARSMKQVLEGLEDVQS